MVDFTTTGITILLLTQLFTVVDTVIKRVESSKCCGSEVEFKKGTSTTNNTTTNNYYGDRSEEE